MYHPCSHHLSLGIQWNNLALLCSFCQFLKFLGCESGMYSGKELIKSAWVLWVFGGKLNLASSLYVVQSLSRVQLKPHEVQHARLPCLTISWYGLLMLWTLSSRFLSSFSVCNYWRWHQVFSLHEVHHHLGCFFRHSSWLMGPLWVSPSLVRLLRKTRAQEVPQWNLVWPFCPRPIFSKPLAMFDGRWHLRRGKGVSQMWCRAGGVRKVVLVMGTQEKPRCVGIHQ